MKANILWIEGRRAEGPSFLPNLRKKGFNIEVVPTGTAAMERIPEFEPDLIVVNAASMRSSGKQICRKLHKNYEELPIVIILRTDQSLNDERCVNEILTLPFTSRKLINRINPLLPREAENTLKAGPIILDLERRLVNCNGREERLTPRLADLLVIFLKNPGIVHERERLFSTVWKTGYTGDTRTLDVHISWLRQAIEEDPRNPQFLKTIRGVGYRLDI